MVEYLGISPKNTQLLIMTEQANGEMSKHVDGLVPWISPENTTLLIMTVQLHRRFSKHVDG